jgi:hypothetical protein
MVKNRKWEKTQEMCAFTPDRSLDWHPKAFCNSLVMGKNSKWEKIQELCAFKPDRSLDWHTKAS